jgi:acyl-coenzyme A thioesterase PaaI-like protein
VLVTQAIQDVIPHNRCWGCGTLNPRGLQIKSHVAGDGTVCQFQPSNDFMAGPPDVLNGGIIATVIDCHCVCTAIAHAYRVAGLELGSEPLIWCVTGSLKVDYLAPTPIAGGIELRARVRETKGRKHFVECTLSAGGKQCARAEVLAIEVPPSWRAG